MSRFKTAALLTTLAVFAAQSCLGLTLELKNVSDGKAVFVPAIIVTEGPSAGTYKIGDQGLTHWIIYNPAALRAWAAQMAGVDIGTVKIYERNYDAPSDDPVISDCEYKSSFDAQWQNAPLIVVTDLILQKDPCWEWMPDSL